MPGFLLDTNVVSELVRASPDPRVLAWVARRMPADLFLSAITLAELVRGVTRLPDGRRRDQLRNWIDGDLPRQFAGRVLAFDDRAARVCGEILGECDRRGRPQSFADVQIAAVALCAGLKVATRNVNDFKQMSVGVVDPWADP